MAIDNRSDNHRRWTETTGQDDCRSLGRFPFTASRDLVKWVKWNEIGRAGRTVPEVPDGTRSSFCRRLIRFRLLLRPPPSGRPNGWSPNGDSRGRGAVLVGSHRPTGLAFAVPVLVACRLSPAQVNPGVNCAQGRGGGGARPDGRFLGVGGWVGCFRLSVSLVGLLLVRILARLGLLFPVLVPVPFSPTRRLHARRLLLVHIRVSGANFVHLKLCCKGVSSLRAVSTFGCSAL